MIKKLIRQFSLMYGMAFTTLRLCLSIILFSVCILYIYIDYAPSDMLFALMTQKAYVIDCVTYSVLLSFGGAFILDYAHISN